MDICVDFDGTCVRHEFPKVGGDIGAIPILKELVEQGHNLILFTMRSDKTGEEVKSPEFPDVKGAAYLTDAVQWFHENNVPLYGIQKNPTQYRWTGSPKAYGHMYIDDMALGCPLIFPKDGTRPYVDWTKVREMLVEMNILD